MALDLLTNSARVELAKLHGSHKEALAFRNRKHLDCKPEKRANVQERVIVVNDLHMAVGTDAETHKFHPSEEFTDEHQRQFHNFLEREWQQAEKENYRLNLCLNGDIVDILQTAFERPGLYFPDGMTDDGKAPKNTPANVLVQLNIIYEGHKHFFRELAEHLLRGHVIDYLPGNHDRHIYNEHVWSGQIELSGRQVKGFVHLIAKEMRKLTNDASLIEESLSRLSRKAFAVYGDVFVDHGDNTDQYNRVTRPLKELFAPSGLHEPMQLAFGDYGVRAGFNHLEPLEPRLSSAPNFSLNFWGRAFKHPFAALTMIRGFFRAASQEGYEKSQFDDLQQRIEDTRALVDRYPDIQANFNACRSPQNKLSKDEIKNGLEAMERANATPLFSNFPKGTGYFSRLYSSWRQALDPRNEHDVVLDSLAAANKYLKINTVVHGHTHVARDDLYITKDESTVRHVDTHTWMDRHGNWGRGVHTFGEKGRGVGVVEVGESASGRPFTDVSLNKIVDTSGTLVKGDLYAEADDDPEKTRERMREIFKANHRQDEAQYAHRAKRRRTREEFA